MSAITINIVIEKNTDFFAKFTIKNFDGSYLNLTGYSAQAKMKKSYYTSNSVVLNVAFVDRVKGIISLSMPAATTATLDPKRYVYDIVLTSPSSVKTRVVEGIATVTPGVT
jgi:hypothetical protein